MSYSRNLARLARSGIPTVDTAQDLRDILDYGGELPDTILTRGAITRGDLGHGIWDKFSSSSAPDSLGTVLVTTNGTRYHRRIDGDWRAAWFGIRPGAANEAHNDSVFQSMLDTCSASGGATILFEEPGEYLLTNQNKGARSFVTLKGASQATILKISYDAAATGGKNIFSPGATGWHPANIPSFIYYDTNNISAGDFGITFKNAADASHFTPGECVWVRSKGQHVGANGVNVIPHFSEMVRIQSIEGGTIYLEHPLSEAVTDPQVTDTGSPMVQFFGIENMTMVAQSPGACFRSNQLYKGVFRDLTLLNTAFTLTGNGYTRCLFENINGTFERNALEFKVGSYRTTVRGFASTFVGTGGELYPHVGVMSGGESTRDLTYEHIRIDCKGASKAGSPLMHFGGIDAINRMHLKDVVISNVGAVSSAVIAVTAGNPDFPYDLTGPVLENVTVYGASCGSCLSLVNHPNATPPYKHPTEVIFRDVTVKMKTPSATSASLDWANGLIIDNCDFGPGELRLAYNTGTIQYVRNVKIANSNIGMIPHNGRLNAVSHFRFSGNRRAGAEEAYRAGTYAVSNNFQATTPTDILPPLTIPPGQNIGPGDYLFAVVEGLLEGNFERYIRVSDKDGALADITIPVNNQGEMMKIEVKTLEIAPDRVRTYCFVYVGSQPVKTTYVHRDRPLSGGETLSIKVWSASTGTYVRVCNAFARVILLGDDEQR